MHYSDVWLTVMMPAGLHGAGSLGKNEMEVSHGHVTVKK